MISLGENRWLVVLVFASLASAVWAAEPNETAVSLAFETGPATPGPLGATNQRLFGRSAYEPLITHRAVYVAAIPRTEPTEFLPRPGDTVVMSALLDFAEQWANLSAPQKALFKTGKRLYTSSISTRDRFAHPMVDRPDPNGPERVLLYAVAEDDAKKMVLAYYQYARNNWRRGISELSKDIQEWADKVAGEKKRLSELDLLLETSQKSFDGLTKTVPYRTESEAHEAIGELDRILNTAQVEIAGIRARMDRILGYRKERPPGVQLSAEAVAKLDLMLVEEDIALQGAAARQEMAMRLRTQANQFLDLKSTLARAAGERKTLVESLDGHQEGLESMQKNLESVRRLEPKIPAKVVIYPVQWTAEPPANN